MLTLQYISKDDLQSLTYPIIVRTRKQERLASRSLFNYKMAIVSFGDVIMEVVLRPETITDGIAPELPEMQQVQPFQQQ